jgi:hypothetical protein
MHFKILNVKYETLPKQKDTLLTFNYVTPMINNRVSKNNVLQ